MNPAVEKRIAERKQDYEQITTIINILRGRSVSDDIIKSLLIQVFNPDRVDDVFIKLGNEQS